MARKPARLERAGALTPRDRMWAAIRSLQGTPTCSWSLAEVHFLTNLRSPEPIHTDSVDSYLRGLAAAQPPYIELVLRDTPEGRKRSELWLWRLVRDVGVDAPRVTKDGKPVTQGLGNELMWQAMKALREFDYVELAAAVGDAAAKAGLAVSQETAKTYCTALCRAGYLALAAPHVGGRAKARYRFVRSMNTGPRAPLIAKDKSVMDGNTGEIRCQGRT